MPCLLPSELAVWSFTIWCSCTDVDALHLTQIVLNSAPLQKRQLWHCVWEQSEIYSKIMSDICTFIKKIIGEQETRSFLWAYKSKGQRCMSIRNSFHRRECVLFTTDFWLSKQISINCVFCLLCLSIGMNLLSPKAVEFSPSDLALGSRNISHWSHWYWLRADMSFLQKQILSS